MLLDSRPTLKKEFVGRLARGHAVLEWPVVFAMSALVAGAHTVMPNVLREGSPNPVSLLLKRRARVSLPMIVPYLGSCPQREAAYFLADVFSHGFHVRVLCWWLHLHSLGI